MAEHPDIDRHRKGHAAFRGGDMNLRDISGLSIFTGALRYLIEGRVRSLAVVCETDIRGLLQLGDEIETQEAITKLNSGTLKWIPLSTIELLEAHIRSFSEIEKNA